MGCRSRPPVCVLGWPCPQHRQRTGGWHAPAFPSGSRPAGRRFRSATRAAPPAPLASTSAPGRRRVTVTLSPFALPHVLPQRHHGTGRSRPPAGAPHRVRTARAPPSPGSPGVPIQPSGHRPGAARSACRGGHVHVHPLHPTFSVRLLLHLALRSPRERVWMAPESRVRTGTFRDIQARCDVRARAEHEPLSRPVTAASGGRLALLPDDRRCRGCCHCHSFYVDVHTEAVQAALAKYKERKVPLPSKRRSVLAHPSVETCTPPGTVAAPGGPTGRSARRCHAVVSCRGGRSWPVGKIWKNRRGRRVSECGALTRGPCPHSAAVPPTSVWAFVCALRCRVCAPSGEGKTLEWAGSSGSGLRTIFTS